MPLRVVDGYCGRMVVRGGKGWDENNADSGRGMIDGFRFVIGSREELWGTKTFCA